MVGILLLLSHYRHAARCSDLNPSRPKIFFDFPLPWISDRTFAGGRAEVCSLRFPPSPGGWGRSWRQLRQPSPLPVFLQFQTLYGELASHLPELGGGRRKRPGRVRGEGQAGRASLAGPFAGRPQADAGCVCVPSVRASEPEKTNWELQNQEAN